MRVVELWRYPVKSMQGERLATADVDALGIEGDRQFAVIDLETGLSLTARRSPELLFASARWSDGDVEITLPDGSTAMERDLDATLSAWLGLEVELRRATADGHGTYEIAVDSEDEAGSPWVRWDGPDGTFHDSTRARLSIMSTASIGEWAPRRFRNNVIVDGGSEDALVGQRVTVGTVLLDVIKPIVRCVMTTRPQPGGIERDLSVLRTINAERGSVLGIGAMVAQAGKIAVADELVVAPDVSEQPGR